MFTQYDSLWPPLKMIGIAEDEISVTTYFMQVSNIVEENDT